MPVPSNGRSCSVRSPPQAGHREAGDVLIGGTFPVTYDRMDFRFPFTEEPMYPECRVYFLAQAMAFAVAEINNAKTLLPNITLGFVIYNTCVSLRRIHHGTMWMLTGKGVPILNYRCQSNPPMVTIIGDSSSTRSIPMARLLGLSRHPQISYFATSPLLSDKVQFPSFLRTIPNDIHLILGLAELVVHFGWTWVGLLTNDNDYGEFGGHLLKEELLKAGVCIAFHEIIPVVITASKTESIIEVLKMSSARVVIAYTTATYMIPVMDELSRQNVSGIVWIATESWAASPTIANKGYGAVMNGTIGLAIHEEEMPGFKDFLHHLHPSTSSNDILIKPFWEAAFGCQWPSLDNNTTPQDHKMKRLCSGTEKLETNENPDIAHPDLRLTYNIYNAVYIVAKALQDMQACMPGNGPFYNNTCASLWNFRPWQLLHYLRRVRLRSQADGGMYFDQHGDPPTVYDIVNWHLQPDGNPRVVTVGRFNRRAPKGQRLIFYGTALHWNTQESEVPLSVCSKSCSTGYRKALQKGHPVCCFDCVPCAEGEVSNETDSTICWLCSSEQWSNDKRTACIPKIIEFLSYQEPLGITLAVVVSLTAFSTCAILCIFIKFRETPIVKANNLELTYLLLGALVLSFLFSLLFIGEPHPLTCLLRQPAFGIIFAICVSCVLAKTIMVVIAFNATKPGSNLRRWLGPQVPVITVSLCTIGQLLICVIWILRCPPFPERNMNLKVGSIIFRCNECSETALWCMLGYMGLLACASFLVAFLARKLPDSFNEAKWITFSMLVFLSVWLSFVPGYLSTQGKYTVAVEVFAITSSSAGLLICIFLPKCYIILLRPDLNTRENLLGKGKKITNKMKTF
ncbi:extracellular calcium-sensing receptor-like [Pleurodeles waltl]|uniref:extracellular calcium-sensing receptor-like n=1 Tax=Pleurodeles waltl TaxID=8319 RepID=UPI003709610C